MDTLTAFGIIFILVALNGLFVAAEFAIIGVRPSRVEQLAQEGNRVAIGIRETVREQRNIDRYIATAQLGISLASLGLGMVGEPAIAHLIEEPLHDLGLDEETAHIVTLAIAIGLMTYLHVVFGEMIPKSLALQNAERSVLVLNWPMRVSQWVFHYAVTILNQIGLLVLRLLRIPPPLEGSRLHTPDELELIVSESYAGGLLDAEEQTLLTNILSFAERRVGQVMTPRTKLVAVPVTISNEALRDVFFTSGYSRLPVYDETIDNIVGIVHLKDLVRHEVQSQTPFNLREQMRQALVIPESVSVELLFQRLKRARLHMAIVLDEYGGTAGVATLEDIVEEVVGEVRDENDSDEATPIVTLGARELRVQGQVLLDTLNDYAPLGTVEYDVQTVGGLVLAELDRPAVVGDVITYHNVTFKVEAVTGRAVDSVTVTWQGDGVVLPDKTSD